MGREFRRLLPSIPGGSWPRTDFLESWWGFAFLPLPPRSLADLERIFWQSINVFNSPSGIVTPLGVLPSAFIALGVISARRLVLGRRWKGGLFLLVSPILLAVVASMLHQYPFHGRLLLFLIPSVHLLVGQGTAALCAAWRPQADRRAWRVLAGSASARHRAGTG